MCPKLHSGTRIGNLSLSPRLDPTLFLGQVHFRRRRERRRRGTCLGRNGAIPERGSGEGTPREEQSLFRAAPINKYSALFSFDAAEQTKRVLLSRKSFPGSSRRTPPGGGPTPRARKRGPILPAFQRAKLTNNPAWGPPPAAAAAWKRDTHSCPGIAPGQWERGGAPH